MTLCGPVVLDIVQHFVERWNEIKKRKYRNDACVGHPFHTALQDNELTFPVLS